MDKYSCTPLHYSISKEHLDVSELLICNGVDINARDWYRNTPSHYACSVVNGDSFIKILMDNGANIGKKYTLLDVYNGKLNVNFLAKCCSIFSNINIQECFPIYNMYINKYLKASIRMHKLLQSAVTILDQIVSDGSYFHYWCNLPFDIRL
ncbi:CRPV-359 [Crowpox virus]|nr:CRPV-359 [Crowpox virus]